ncbi:helix-turn-helix domain-containing protein [Xanthomonas sp. SI]|uniref:helix-turn-helix domain-containing protein n=1 Tax=Xanthomonas sp. SI TaxID=2724123 RepID=UPI00163A6531|nr:helix-turn-helix domain-containing protein [Xanthomonas sp. SI]MBH1634995.1 helix-turn-helix domain-containing protein [Stenotrophomonas maltophilia]
MTARAFCPCCGQRWPGEETAINVDDLERDCRARGYMVTADGRVHEDVAAELLGRSVRTLEDWARSEKIPTIRVNRRRTYRLSDIAALMVER